jgi:secretion/DNA translocation related CpaE-like protein
VLVVGADPDLVGAARRAAGSAGAGLAVVETLALARRHWPVAPVVVVCADAARAEALLPRRPGVVLLGHDDGDAAVWPDAVRLGAEHVALLPSAQEWLAERLAESSSPAGASVIGVVAGRGGAGASVLSAALAVTAARGGARAALLDLDPFGGGLDLLIGAEQRTGLRWADLAATSGRLSPGELRDALPEQAGVRVLSFGRGVPPRLPDDASRHVVDALRRGHDVVVADIGRGHDEGTRAAARHVLRRCSTVLLVVPPDVRGVTAAAVQADRLAPLVADLRVVVRGRSPGGLVAAEAADALALPLAAALPDESGLAEAIERGEPPGREGGALAKACQGVIAAVVGAAEAA